MADRIVVPVEPGFTEVFKSHHGPVGRDLMRRGRRVQYAARRQAEDETGVLDRSIRISWLRRSSGDLGLSIGSSVSYALLHHEGSEPHIIRPKNAKILRWVDEDGVVRFARVVHHPGTKPNRYLLDNLHLAVK